MKKEEGRKEEWKKERKHKVLSISPVTPYLSPSAELKYLRRTPSPPAELHLQTTMFILLSIRFLHQKGRMEEERNKLSPFVPFVPFRPSVIHLSKKNKE
jgi:hypothetical protein